jgi:hypothetical protein
MELQWGAEPSVTDHYLKNKTFRDILFVFVGDCFVFVFSVFQFVSKECVRFF